MCETIWSIIINMVSDFLFLIFVYGFLLLVFMGVGKKRKEAYDYFGISHKNPVLKVYISRLEVKVGGSISRNGVAIEGFSGPALMQNECEGADYLKSIFTDKRLNLIPNIIKKIMSVREIGYIQDLVFTVELSPDKNNYSGVLNEGREPIVLIGSDVYSHIVGHIYDDDYSFITFVEENSKVRYDASISKEEPTFAIKEKDGTLKKLNARMNNGREIGTVQRVTTRLGKKIFMCAGISSSTSKGSVYYLAKEWKNLEKRFKDMDYLVVLSFANQIRDVSDFVDYVEIESRINTPNHAFKKLLL